MARQVSPTVAERRRLVVELRRGNTPFDEIGRTLGVTAQRAHQIYTDALAALPIQAVAEHRVEALERIDEAERALRRIATDPDTSPRTAVEAWSAVRQWEERRARLLGLDHPTRNEVTVITEDAVAAAIRQVEAQVAEAEAIERAEALLGRGES
jgi:hypothetical protein